MSDQPTNDIPAATEPIGSSEAAVGSAEVPSTEKAEDFTPSVNKGKGKAVAPQEEEEDDEDEDEDDEDDDDEDEDEDESMNAEEDLSALDMSNIVYSGRRRAAAPIDYSSEEAMAKAGLTKEAEASADAEEEDPEFQAAEMDEE